MLVNTIHSDMLTSPLRTIESRVELYKSSTLSTSGEIISINPIDNNIQAKIINKNLIPYPYYDAEGTIGGITYTFNEDLSITANGTATAHSSFLVAQNLLIPAGTYSISSDNLTSSNELRMTLYNVDGSISSRLVGNNTFTTISDMLITIQILIPRDTILDNVTYNPKLEVASDLSAVTISQYNKNLISFPYEQAAGTYAGVTIDVNDDGSLTLNGTSSYAFTFTLQKEKALPFKGGKRYRINLTNYTGLVMSVSYYASAANKEANITNYFGNNFVWNDDYIFKALYFQVNGAGYEFSNFVLKPQVELGENITEYVSPIETKEYTVNEDGTINGKIEAIYPTTVLATSSGETLEVSYTANEYVNDYKKDDYLQSFIIERAGENSKFFGFGVSQKLELKLVDKERAIEITKDNSLKPLFAVEGDIVSPTPLFAVSEVQRDENTNGLTITAYDSVYRAKNHTVSELNLTAPYTILQVAEAIAAFLGLSLVTKNIDTGFFNIFYSDGANFEGTETLREVLDAIAEATQTIYYIDLNKLTFKKLDINGDSLLTINKADYFELRSKPSHTLASIVSATELGDNVSIDADGITGETQYVRNNPFWELREDLNDLLAAAIDNIAGITINPFECKWRGNYLLEIGDKINLVTKDDSIITSYLLDDKLTYDGGLLANTIWEYSKPDSETANPSTLGEALKQTYARVDKANKEIELVVSKVEGYEEEFSSMELTTNSITASVSKIDSNVSELTNEVNAKMSAEDVSISIQTALGEGTERVTTSTGFTFNEEGLHISKENSEITTSITEDGMTVYRNNKEVLTADNLGVKAEDLHATTFLIIGNNSRLEDYKHSRTGCFWIGG